MKVRCKWLTRRRSGVWMQRWAHLTFSENAHNSFNSLHAYCRLRSLIELNADYLFFNIFYKGQLLLPCRKSIKNPLAIYSSTYAPLHFAWTIKAQHTPASASQNFLSRWSCVQVLGCITRLQSLNLSLTYAQRVRIFVLHCWNWAIILSILVWDLAR